MTEDRFGSGVDPQGSEHVEDEGTRAGSGLSDGDKGGDSVTWDADQPSADAGGDDRVTGQADELGVDVFGDESRAP